MEQEPRAASFTLRLPYPPSVNAMYTNVQGVGRVKSSVYKKWLKAATDTLWEQAKAYIGGPIKVSIKAQRKHKSADIDNLIKPILDFLVTHGFVDDDRHVEAVSAAWADVEGAHVTVEPANRLLGAAVG